MNIYKLKNSVVIEDLTDEEFQKIQNINEGKFETENILPRPIIRNKHGEFLKEYTPRGFFAELQAGFFEAIEKNLEWFLYKSGVPSFKSSLSISVAKDDFAEELGKIITICISFLNAIDYDEKKRSELFEKINKENEEYGCFDEEN